ncbi:MAG TPA: type IV toxin-antitoxin system AbiEi family antitoxin domain-containing protein [Jatrophihabitans sp.]
MRELPNQAKKQCGVFTIEQALSAGWSQATLSRKARAGELIRLRAGAFALPPPSELTSFDRSATFLAQQGVAAALQLQDAAVSHSAALAVYGLPLFHAPKVPCVTKPQDVRTRQLGLHLHRKKLEPSQLDPSYEFLITSVARTCIDVACEQGVVAGVIAADAALAAGRITGDELLFARTSIKGDIGSPDAGRLLDLVDSRAESPLESLSRVNMHGRVPAPLVQAELFAEDGTFIGRADFLWPELGVVGEADGMAKYSIEDGVLAREKWRQDRLNETNAVIARWGWDMAQSPLKLAAYLEERFAEAQARRTAGIRLRWRVPNAQVSRKY